MSIKQEIDNPAFNSVGFPSGTKSIFQRVEKYNHHWYLECRQTRKYLGQTRHSEFLAQYRSRLGSGVYPVTFSTYAEAVQHAQVQTNRHKLYLEPQPICNFFTCYLMGKFVISGEQIDVLTPIHDRTHLNTHQIAQLEDGHELD